MKKFFFVGLVLLTGIAAIAQNTRSVLFVGNSYTSYNNLPRMVQQVAESMGDSLVYALSAPGGATLQSHCSNDSTSYLLTQFDWDVVVLQEQSQLPAFPDAQVAAEVYPYAQLLVEAIYGEAYCGEPMFYMTWGRKNGDQQNAEAFPVIGTYEGQFARIRQCYEDMAVAFDASVCPVGVAWDRVRTLYPEIELYQRDGSHPSLAGTYLAACAFYAMIFERDPAAITFTAGLPAVLAEKLCQTASDVVYAHIESWQRVRPSLHVVANGDRDDQTRSFFAVPMHADTLVWNYGDGTIEYEPITASTMKTHTFEREGVYTVTVEARRHCLSATDTLMVQIGNSPEPIDPPVGIEGVEPHKAKWQREGSLWRVDCGELKVEKIEVTDLLGRVVKRVHHNVVDLKGLPTGIYTLQVVTTAGFSFQLRAFFS